MANVTFGKLFVKVATQDKAARLLDGCIAFNKQAAAARQQYVKDTVYGLMQKQAAPEAAPAQAPDKKVPAFVRGALAAGGALGGLANVPPFGFGVGKGLGLAATRAVTKNKLPEGISRGLAYPATGSVLRQVGPSPAVKAAIEAYKGTKAPSK